MIALLTSRRLDRPVRVSAAPRGRSAHEGWVESSIEDGELFLEDAAGKVFRLTWQAGQQERRRALPAGQYTLRGYRIRRRDDRKIPWHISVSSPGLRTVVVQAGQTAHVQIDPAISIRCQLRRGDRGLMLSASVSGEGGSGLSIYRRGKRLALHYRLTTARGQTVGGGVMRYG